MNQNIKTLTSNFNSSKPFCVCSQFIHPMIFEFFNLLFSISLLVKEKTEIIDLKSFRIKHIFTFIY